MAVTHAVADPSRAGSRWENVEGRADALSWIFRSTPPCGRCVREGPCHRPRRKESRRATASTQWPRMSAEYFYGAGRKDAPRRSGKASRTDPRGRPATGRIAKILVGQGHGFIRLRDDREIFFHRGDVREGTAFNDLHIGDPVTCKLLEDSVSGARARRVQRRSGVSD